ncbi:hypothetical protein [Salinispora arenicola]|uniref:hypothetical protein n=1 Tax=Salinispora arenicola TaxID=168697 RepID=UPI002079F3F4|nr:hypothetical protein [Salinispora arenicola]MCN0152539.1 hypothetical protein [Salinispora arenicola]
MVPPIITALRDGECTTGAELFEDLGTVRGDGRLLDVAPLRDLLGAVPERWLAALLMSGLLVKECGGGLQNVCSVNLRVPTIPFALAKRRYRSRVGARRAGRADVRTDVSALRDR